MGAAALLSFLLALAPTPARDVRLPVRDRLDRFVPDASACVVTEQACESVRVRREKGDWVAALPVPPDPVTVKLRVSAPGFDAVEVDVGPDVTSTAPLKLTSKASLSATFLPVDEKRTVALEVSLTESNEPPFLTRPQTIEKKVELRPKPKVAKVVFEDVPPGAYILAWGGAEIASGRKAVKVARDQAGDAGEIAVARGILLDGAVHDEFGAAVAGARVSLQQTSRFRGLWLSALAGSDGRFSLAGVPLGEKLDWLCSAAGLMNASGVWGGETRLEIVMERAQRILGRLVDERGAPVEGAKISAVLLDADGGRFRTSGPAPAMSDREGDFSFFRVLPLKASITIEARGFQVRRLAVEAPSGSEKRDVDLGKIELSRGRSLRGRVVDSGGNPLPGAKVTGQLRKWTRTEDGRLYRDPASAVTDEAGEYQLAGLPSKEALLLAAAKEGFATASKEPEPDAEIVDFVLGRGGRVEGRLCGSAADLALAEMVLDPAGVARQSTKPDGSGLFTFDLVARGTWTIDRNWVFTSPLSSGSVNWMSGAASERVTVEEGKTSTIMIGCDGIQVSGAALLDGRPLASHVGSLGREVAPEADLMTDAAGRFATRVPGPGRYEARLMNTQSPGLNLMGAFCDVPAGGTDLCILSFNPAPGK